MSGGVGESGMGTRVKDEGRTVIFVSDDRAFPLPERARKLILARLPKFLDDEA